MDPKTPLHDRSVVLQPSTPTETVPASTRLFSLPELLELILHHLPAKSLLQLRRTNYTFLNTITSSQTLSSRLFLNPKAQIRKLSGHHYGSRNPGRRHLRCELHFNELVPPTTVHRHRRWNLNRKSEGWSLSASIPRTSLRPIVEVRLRPEFKEDRTWKNATMFLTEPPVPITLRVNTWDGDLNHRYLHPSGRSCILHLVEIDILPARISEIVGLADLVRKMCVAELHLKKRNWRQTLQHLLPESQPGLVDLMAGRPRYMVPYLPKGNLIAEIRDGVGNLELLESVNRRLFLRERLSS